VTSFDLKEERATYRSTIRRSLQPSGAERRRAPSLLAGRARGRAQEAFVQRGKDLLMSVLSTEARNRGEDGFEPSIG